MASTKLYELAFAFKRSKIWKVLFDDDIFAVQLSNGEIGYCSVMGRIAKKTALCLYVGDPGWSSYMRMIRAEDDPDQRDMRECLMTQDSIQCVLDNKDTLTVEETSAVQSYAKAHSLTLRGKNAFPKFVRCRPYYAPWPMEDEKDAALLQEALEATLFVAEQLRERIATYPESVEPEELTALGFLDHQEDLLDEAEVPLLLPTENGYTWSTMRLPHFEPEPYPTPLFQAASSKTAFRKMPKAGKMEIMLCYGPEPIQEKKNARPFFPAYLLGVAPETGKRLLTKAIRDYQSNPAAALDRLAEAIQQSVTAKDGLDACPQQLLVRDERTKRLLLDFCQQTGIELLDDECPHLDDVLEEQFEG